MKNNYSSMFSQLTTRKPYRWDDVPMHRTLRREQIQALRELPVVVTKASPLEDFLGEEPPTECVVRVGERTFYVNTEGYSYARYAFEFPASILEHQLEPQV